jgi:hypothetical protein
MTNDYSKYADKDCDYCGGSGLSLVKHDVDDYQEKMCLCAIENYQYERERIAAEPSQD